MNTVIENKTVFSQGNGTILTEDNQSSIKWDSYDANLVKGGIIILLIEIVKRIVKETGIETNITEL